MSEYFPKLFKNICRDVKDESDQSHATKPHSTGATGVAISNLAAKSDLASLKAEVNKIDLDTN